MKIKFFVFNVALAAVAFLIMSATFNAGKPWEIPEKYKKMKNTVKSDANSIKIGKGLWDKNCKMCHGANGKGDGMKAANLKTPMVDFTTKEVKGQTDGELYYKSFIGRDEMPNFEKKITDETDRWHVINFMRSLK